MLPRPCGANTNTKKYFSQKLQNFAIKKGAENGEEIERGKRDIASRFQCLFPATVVLLVGNCRGCHIVKYDGIEPLLFLKFVQFVY